MDLATYLDGVDRRLDSLDTRLGRVEAQNESIIGSVVDLGKRVTGLEARGAA